MHPARLSARLPTRGITTGITRGITRGLSLLLESRPGCRAGILTRHFSLVFAFWFNGVYIIYNHRMSTPDVILQLVENFEFHRRTYLSQDYNEAQVRREFVDPFFEALGWDMFNKANYASAYKDVIYEDAIHMVKMQKLFVIYPFGLSIF